MKTTIELKREVAGLVNDLASMIPTSKEYKAVKRRIEYLNECILYLQTSPSTEFLEREVKRLEANLSYIDKQFGLWIASQHFAVQAAPQKAKKTFEERAGVPRLRAHLSTIEFLLS